MEAQDTELREMRAAEAAVFADWEKKERPYPWTADHFLETLNSTTSWTLVWEAAGPEGKDLVGFGVVQIIGEEAYLLNFMLSPLHRRQGKGAEFLSRIMAWCARNEATTLLLDADPKNASACKLYERMGFETLTRRPRAYPGGEDAIVMRKKL